MLQGHGKVMSVVLCMLSCQLYNPPRSNPIYKQYVNSIVSYLRKSPMWLGIQSQPPDLVLISDTVDAFYVVIMKRHTFIELQ